MASKSQTRDDVVLNVAAVDVETGLTEHASVKRGDYVILCTEPAYIASIQTYPNGTHVITVKGRL